MNFNLRISRVKFDPGYIRTIWITEIDYYSGWNLDYIMLNKVML